MSHIRHFLFAAFALLNTPAFCQERVDILKILDNFTISGVAAKKCLPQDDTTDTAVLANLMNVSIRATEALKVRRPDLNDQQLIDLMKKRGETLKAITEQELSTRGCNSDFAKQLLALYKKHAEWKP